jgi:FMN phosphatase YigB (HAD superfamily)
LTRIQPDTKLWFEGVVFDLFHTIVDPEDFRPKNERPAQIASELLDVDTRSFGSYWSETRPVRNTRRSETVTKLLRDFLASQGRRADPETLARIDYEMGRYQDMAILNPRPDVLAALRTLSDLGGKVGLLSNCDEREIRQWSNSPLAACFNAVCFSCDTGHVKPEPEAYTEILDRLGVVARRSVYVGDGGSNELDGAVKAGFGLVVFMAGFVTTNGLRKPEELEVFDRTAHVSINDISELLHLTSKQMSQFAKEKKPE